MDTPHVGDYDNEDLYNYETDGFDWRRLHVDCPGCGKDTCPGLFREREIIESGWRWVGLDHKEPFATYSVRHAACGTQFRFSTYTPQ